MDAKDKESIEVQLKIFLELKKDLVENLHLLKKRSGRGDIEAEKLASKIFDAI